MKMDITEMVVIHLLNSKKLTMISYGYGFPEKENEHPFAITVAIERCVPTSHAFMDREL